MFFFFQAEDGIRDYKVTGVQTCALPICIAGYEVTELSYVGVEPWLVLLRNMEHEVRYAVVVFPDGSIGGRLRVPFLPFERGFVRPAMFQQGPGRRRRGD